MLRFTPQSRTLLRQMLVDHFRSEDLDILCADTGEDYSDIPHRNEGIGTYALELIKYLDQRGKSPMLLELAKKARLNVDFSGVVLMEEIAPSNAETTTANPSPVAKPNNQESIVVNPHSDPGDQPSKLKWPPEPWVGCATILSAIFAALAIMVTLFYAEIRDFILGPAVTVTPTMLSSPQLTRTTNPAPTETSTPYLTDTPRPTPTETIAPTATSTLTPTITPSRTQRPPPITRTPPSLVAPTNTPQNTVVVSPVGNPTDFPKNTPASPVVNPTFTSPPQETPKPTFTSPPPA